MNKSCSFDASIIWGTAVKEDFTWLLVELKRGANPKETKTSKIAEIDPKQNKGFLKKPLEFFFAHLNCFFKPKKVLNSGFIYLLSRIPFQALKSSFLSTPGRTTLTTIAKLVFYKAKY